jgi:hypothetical protein
MLKRDLLMSQGERRPCLRGSSRKGAGDGAAGPTGRYFTLPLRVIDRAPMPPVLRVTGWSAPPTGIVPKPVRARRKGGDMVMMLHVRGIGGSLSRAAIRHAVPALVAGMCVIAAPAGADVLNAATNRGPVTVEFVPLNVPFNGQPTVSFQVPGRSPERVAIFFSANCASYGGPGEDLRISIEVQLQSGSFVWRKMEPTDPSTLLCAGGNFYDPEGAPLARATVIGVEDLRPGTYKVRVRAFMAESSGYLEDMAIVVSR